MIIEKTYSATIDVHDPIDSCANEQKSVESHLNRIYVGRCYGGAFIIKIVRIEKTSGCMIQATNLSAEGYINVQFVALVSVVGKWDLLSGVVIKTSAPTGPVGISVAEESPMIVSILPSPETRSISVDQTISVRIVQTQYNPRHENASSIGVLLTCDKQSPVFLLNGQLTHDDIAPMAFYVERIEKLLLERQKLVESRLYDIFFFEKMLYSYITPVDKEMPHQTVKSKVEWKGPGGYNIPTGTTAVDILEIIGKVMGGNSVDVSGIWSRDLALYRSSPLICRANSGKPKTWSDPISATPQQAFMAMLQSVHEFLKIINEMVAIYTSEKMIKAHDNIWKIMGYARLNYNAN